LNRSFECGAKASILDSKAFYRCSSLEFISSLSSKQTILDHCFELCGKLLWMAFEPVSQLSTLGEKLSPPALTSVSFRGSALCVLVDPRNRFLIPSPDLRQALKTIKCPWQNLVLDIGEARFAPIQEYAHGWGMVAHSNNGF
jgi:hypothetical protein